MHKQKIQNRYVLQFRKQTFFLMKIFGKKQKAKNIVKNYCVKTEWTRRDLNPRHLRCERSYLPLIYEPGNISNL